LIYIPQNKKTNVIAKGDLMILSMFLKEKNDTSDSGRQGTSDGGGGGREEASTIESKKATPFPTNDEI
jgi:hypothetical protein